MMQQDKICSIAMEWHRVFPKLQGMPYTADVYSQYILDGYLSKESADKASMSSNEEMPILDFNDYDTDWFVL
jgi:hypothetical protein